MQEVSFNAIALYCDLNLELTLRKLYNRLSVPSLVSGFSVLSTPESNLHSRASFERLDGPNKLRFRSAFWEFIGRPGGTQRCPFHAGPTNVPCSETVPKFK